MRSEMAALVRTRDEQIEESLRPKRALELDVGYHQELEANNKRLEMDNRLMAPRVLHFCRDQIAWECSEFDAAEGQPQGMPNFQLTSYGVVEETRLKGLVPATDGKRLRQIRRSESES